jgi:hypothetical protein
MPTLVRSVGTLLMGAVLVLSIWGIVWATKSPNPQAPFGQAILALGALAAAGGVWVLWSAPRSGAR